MHVQYMVCVCACVCVCVFLHVCEGIDIYICGRRVYIYLYLCVCARVESFWCLFAYIIHKSSNRYAFIIVYTEPQEEAHLATSEVVCKY